MNRPSTVTLESGDGKTNLVISLAAAEHSLVIKTTLEDKNDDEPVPIRSVDGNSLRIVAAFLTHLVEEPMDDVPIGDEVVQTWYCEFLRRLNETMLFSVFKAADRIEIEPLLKICRLEIMKRIKANEVDVLNTSLTTGLENLPDLLRLSIWQSSPWTDLVKTRPHLPPNLQTHIPELQVSEGPPLNNTRGDWSMYEYIRLPAVSGLVVSFWWKDQGWGNRKGRLGITICRNNVPILHHSFTEPAWPSPHSWEYVEHDVPLNILQFCRQNDEIVIWYCGVHGNSGHSLSVSQFKARYWTWTKAFHPVLTDGAMEEEHSFPPVGASMSCIFNRRLRNDDSVRPQGALIFPRDELSLESDNDAFDDYWDDTIDGFFLRG